MSQIIQIAKEQPSNLSLLKFGDAKNAPDFSQETCAMDVLGLSWMYLDNPELYLAKPEEV